MQILFIDGRHEQLYSELCTRMKYLDEYHRTTAYLLSLDNVCRDHIADITTILRPTRRCNKAGDTLQGMANKHEPQELPPAIQSLERLQRRGRTP